MYRFDLELCDGDSGRCFADMDENAYGEWVRYEDAAERIAALEAENDRLRAVIGGAVFRLSIDDRYSVRDYMESALKETEADDGD
jgi:hypothetical protein